MNLYFSLFIIILAALSCVGGAFRITAGRKFQAKVEARITAETLSRLSWLRPSLTLRMSTVEEIERENAIIMNEWLENMIYSGDMNGYLRRNAADLLCQEFLDFLAKRVASEKDADERAAVQQALSLVKEAMDLTDGMGQMSGVAFENRLDKILFAPPARRKSYIESISDEITPGFVDYIQKELKETSDQDSKVVLASILKFIGEVKQQDVVGGAAVLLSQADESLGEDFAKKKEVNKELAAVLALNNRNEQILGGLMFSQNDLIEDILNNIHYIDEEFITWLTKKVDTVSDIEERVGLSSLLETINKVLEKIKEAENEAGIQNIDEELTMEQVKLRMQEVQMGAPVKEASKIASTFAVQEDKMSTFNKVISLFRERLSTGMSLEDAVMNLYDLCDYTFMENLKSEESAGGENSAFYTELLSTISKAMAQKIGTAQDRLTQILSKRTPPGMISEIVSMARKGEIDESLILLMEANAQQARKAGSTQAADVITSLVKRANEEREKKLPDEQRLLRALIRLDKSEERKGLLYAAFKPAKSLDENQGFVEGPPLITPPAFIAVVRNLITSFGNVDSFDIMNRAKVIIDEAQIVATELYGEGMTPRQQQEYMFKERTMSVWDLANYEDKALTSGEEVPWGGNKQYDNMSPEDVINEVRTRKIGGADDTLNNI